MDDEYMNFKSVMEGCLRILESMDAYQRNSLALYWKEISSKFDQLFSEQMSIMDADLADEKENSHIASNTVDNMQGVTEERTFTAEHDIEESSLHCKASPLQQKELMLRQNVASFESNKKPDNHTKQSRKRKMSTNCVDKNEIFDNPRRSGRRVKPPSIYNDFVTSSGFYSKNFFVKDDQFSGGEEQDLLNQDVIAEENSSVETSNDTEAVPVGSVITFKTVNPFPESISTQPLEVGTTDIVFHLQLSTESVTGEDGPEKQTEMDTFHPVIQSGQSCDSEQVSVTVPNKEPDADAVQFTEETHNQELHENSSMSPEITGPEQQSEADDAEKQQPSPEDGEQMQNAIPPRKSPAQTKSSSSKDTPSQKAVPRIKKSKDGRYECPDCNKKINNYSNLRVHMRIHSGEKPYCCRVCGRLFSTITNMTRHERTTHDKEKLWQCDQCQKRFTEKKSLVTHQRIHSGERPYKCTICTLAFAQAGTLKTHLHRHMGIKGHLCDFCGKSFRQKSQLSMHQRRHSDTRNFKCTDCPKAFVTKTELNRHQMSHSGERPYLCSLCPKTFTRLQYLKEHINLHNNTTPYQCKICRQSFRDLASHAKHAKRHAVAASVDQAAGAKDKEGFMFLDSSETEYYIQGMKATKLNDATPKPGSMQVPTMVSEECVEETAVDELDITNLTMTIHHPVLESLVEVSTAGTTYIPGTITANADSQVEADNQVAIEVNSVSPSDATQLIPGKHYILIEPLGEGVMEQVETYDIETDIVEASSQET